MYALLLSLALIPYPAQHNAGVGTSAPALCLVGNFNGPIHFSTAFAASCPGVGDSGARCAYAEERF